MRKLLVTLFALSIYLSPINAQINGTVQLGLTEYQGDVHCISDEGIDLFDALNGSAGIGLHIPFTKVIGFRGELNYFRLTGDESDFDDNAHSQRSWNFSNNLLELSGLLDWEILGKRRFSQTGFRRTLTPVIFAGVGVAFTNSKVDWNTTDPANRNVVRDNVYDKNAELAIPVGLGLKYYFSEKLALGFETGVRLPVSDYYDGISRAGNPEENDMYYFSGVKAFFGLGGKNDSDKDGVVDRKDNCPDIPGSKKLNGCPDSDFDGITDAEDKCPTLRGSALLGGCPDTDKDGIIDPEDNCPLVAGTTALSGCPDRDNDGIVDQSDSCPDEHGNGSISGCPDSDGDGVIDAHDKCPEVAGMVTLKGCPLNDADGDRITDAEDDCPNIRGTKETNGCPDSDKDGIKNSEDKCPFVKGDAPNGCPDGIVPPPPPLEGLGALQSRSVEATSTCNCYGNANSIFNLPLDKKPKVLNRLGSNPEFGNLHDLDGLGFYDKLTKAYNHNADDRIFLDELFRAMGYSGFSEATPEMFIETVLPYGIAGNIGYSKSHKTLYARLNNSEKDLQAFKIISRNGCDIHFMKTCGNHFFFCPK